MQMVFTIFFVLPTNNGSKSTFYWNFIGSTFIVATWAT